MEYRSQMIARQRETAERDGGMDRQAMALHHAEQEVVRLQCLLDSAAEVAPHICKAIHNVSPEFNFKERGLQVCDVDAILVDIFSYMRSYLLYSKALARRECENGKSTLRPNLLYNSSNLFVPQ